LATPNYGYEKRQKELAKKRKNEEKLKLKAERKKGGPLAESDFVEPDHAETMPEPTPASGAGDAT
jgi:hypothetical protein